MPRLLLGAAVLVAGNLIARKWMMPATELREPPADEEPGRARPVQKSREGPFIALAIVSALLALVWSFLCRPNAEADPSVLLGIGGLVLLLPAIWRSILPWDYDPTPARTRVRPPDSLENDCKNALLLLGFLKSQGKVGKPDGPDRIGEQTFDEMRASLALVHHKLSNPPVELSADEENEFYRHLSLLQATANPVTVESLDEALPETSGARSHGEMEVDLYGRLMLVAVVFLVIFQAYTAVGLTLHTGLLEAHRRVREIHGLQAKKPAASTVSEPQLGAEAEKYLAAKELISANELLGAWVRPVAGLLAGLGIRYDESVDQPGGAEKPAAGEPAAKKETAAQPPVANEPAGSSGAGATSPPEPRMPSGFDKNRTQARLILDFLNNYLLPLLYGWAGAMVYVVRRLTGEVTGLSYRRGEINYPVRIWLGGIAGLAIGWFQTASASPEVAAKPQLTPLALAFLAGFGVEIFFALLDRGLRAFTDQPSGKTAKT